MLLLRVLILSPEDAELVTEKNEECLIGFPGIGTTLHGCTERGERLQTGTIVF